MATMGIRDRMQHDLRAAMKARDRMRIGVLRATLGAISNAEAVPSDAQPNIPGRREPTEVARRELSDADIEAVVGREVAELRADTQLYRERADTGPLEDLEARIEVLVSYLS
jgi:uncharacterized protein YqeY